MRLYGYIGTTIPGAAAPLQRPGPGRRTTQTAIGRRVAHRLPAGSPYVRATNYNGVWGAGLQTADGRCGGTLEAPAPSVKRSASSGKTLRLHPTGGRAPSRSAQTYRPRSRAAPRATARAGIMPFPTGRRCTGAALRTATRRAGQCRPATGDGWRCCGGRSV